MKYLKHFILITFHFRKPVPLLVIILSLVNSTFSYAQTDRRGMILFEEIRIVPDETDSITFEQISSVDIQSIPETNAPYITSRGKLWVVLDSLGMAGKTTDDYTLSLIGNAAEVELRWYSQSGSWKVQRGGTNIREDSDSYSLVNLSFPIEGIDTSYPVYIKFNQPVIPVIVLEPKQGMVLRESQKLIYYSLILGGLVFILFFNTIRWLYTRESIFALYSGIVLTYLAIILAFGGNNLIYYVLNISPHLKFVINISAMLFFNIMAASYAIAFLNLKENNRRFYHILLGIIGLLLIAYTFLIFYPAAVVVVANGSIAIMLVAVLSIGIAQWRKGHPYLSFYVIAYVIFTVVHISYSIIRNIDITYPYVDPVPIFFFGFLIEALFLNISLNRRIDFEKEVAQKEKIASQKSLLDYQQKQNHVLEEKVSQRTKELEENNVALYKVQEDLQKAYSKVRLQNRELNKTIETLRLTQSQLVESEKMAALGVLTAGIAHEINNPVNFVYAGANSLKDNLKDIRQVLDAYDEVDSKNAKNKLSKVQKLKSKVGYEKLIDYVDRSAVNVLKGAERTSEIVKGLKTFSRGDDGKFVSTDIQECIENALVLLSNQYKDRIQISREFGQVRNILGSPGKLSQVLVNILVNAIQAIEGKGEITISTGIEKEGHDEDLVVKIKDSGKGISPEESARIFEPFYTTKDVGEGTGLGLSISHTIIEEHKGKIEIESELGNGTTVTIKLPSS